MPPDQRYETALETAKLILGELSRPELTEPVKLARVTYAVLDALHRSEARANHRLSGYAEIQLSGHSSTHPLHRLAGIRAIALTIWSACAARGLAVKTAIR